MQLEDGITQILESTKETIISYHPRHNKCPL